MPVLHVVAGPNGSGKTTFCTRVLIPATRLPFVNADEIARARWPGREEAQGHAAAKAAEQERARLMAARRSFIAETVFSHPSKLDLVLRAGAAGYLVTLHIVLVPEELSVARVRLRAEQGGHAVPIAKVRARYRRLWPLLEKAALAADETVVYDNSRAATPFRVVARYRNGQAELRGAWPEWSPVNW